MRNPDNQFENFPHAPITEALLDIRVELSSDMDKKKIEDIYSSVKDRFPQKQVGLFHKTKIQMDEIKHGTFELESDPVGWRFISQDHSKIFQARYDGFTFNQLKPYKNWEEFKKEAKELWEKYEQWVCPKSIVRISLRFINRIEIPLPMNDFKDYLLTAPEIANGIPQGMSDYFMQLFVPFDEVPCMAIITQTVDKGKKNNSSFPLIYDIDILHHGNYKPKDDNIWVLFDNLRVVKNTIFINSLTEKAKELFR